MDNTQSKEQPSNLAGGHPPIEHPHGMAAIFLTIMGTKPFQASDLPEGISRILTGYSSAYLMPISDDNRNFCLIDSGSDTSAAELMAVLRYNGVDATAVKAIFLTHGHADHTSGIHNFPEADVYIGPGDHDFVEGTGAADGFIPHLTGKQPEIAIADKNKLHDLTDGQHIHVGNREVVAFKAAGHTRGSFVFLIGDMLFVGDALTFGKNGEGQKPPLPVSRDITESVHSLEHLVQRFDEEQLSVKTVVPSHSGTGSFDAVRDLARQSS